jgi:hypothetical protein
MRFAERFLVILALISIGMRLSGLKDGATMELIALPLLALFYLISTPVMLLRKKEDVARRVWVLGVLGVFTGVGIAYCIISLMLYTLNWLPRLDMLENSGLILAALLTIFALQYRKTKHGISGQYLLRLALLLGVIIIAFFLPFPGLAAISI